MVVALISNAFTKVFGSRNQRMVRTYQRRVDEINALEPQMRPLTDAQLRQRAADLRQQVASGKSIASVQVEALALAREVMDRAVGIRGIFNPVNKFDPAQLPGDARRMYDEAAQQIAATPPSEVPGCKQQENVHHQWDPAPAWMTVEVPVGLYEAVRSLYPLSKPPFRARPFDVQLIGGMVLSEGRISEMKTGEGKTIVAPLACFLACLEGLQCHVVTVNDYLVQRDRDWVFPFHFWLGFSVGAIHPYHMQADELKKQAYSCNIIYGTNSEFGFDYLRDNMKMSVDEQVQKRREFCIIDEVDSILIDEARTPLIISGPAHDDAPRYDLADSVARHLMQKQREWDNANETVQAATARIKGFEGDIRNARDKDRVPAMRDAMRKLQEQLPALEEERARFTQYYEVEREKKASHLTHDGVAEAQKQADIGSFYVGSNMDFPHLLENALRAHVVYQRDKDYVVQNGEVIIVDEFTGRLMVGRQWSDGLHQAVEAKEKVKVKQETQTMATVTIQNFFKLYKRLAGMTGTASTEATEFHDIYKLDVVSIPTNVPVVRADHNDLIYTSEKGKWNAILDEIKRFYDLGRPVLVGTTSVEKSEELSNLLTKRHGVKHEVLNAKQHEREAHIVENAGELGAVMIATNMAGRGTDIKLRPIDRGALIRHWQTRNLLTRDAKPEMTDDQIIRLACRHMARVQLGMSPKDVEALSDDEVRLKLLRHWCKESGQVDPDKAANLSADDCMKALDKSSNFLFHRMQIYKHTEEMGGLHIVGTERHEARRIDNQLRGRSGRQGDNGSSRFFISLEDDLMKMFAGPRTLSILSRFGMKEGDAIEHPMITRSVERAQKKVEERNYEIRKQLLEYDEVMEHQRNAFYAIRQDVLEGREIATMIFEYIADSVHDAAAYFLNKEFVPSQISEWCRVELDVLIESFKLRETDLGQLKKDIMQAAYDDTRNTIEVTIGEYMSDDIPKEEWDLRSLQQWAMSRFSVDLKQNKAREMTPQEVQEMLITAAHEQLDRKDLTPLANFLVPHYAQGELAKWASTKFEIQLDPQELHKLPNEQVAAFVLEKAREAYKQREIEYPIEFVLDMVFQVAQSDGQFASEQLASWANRRFELAWDAETVKKTAGKDLHAQLVDAQRQWTTGGRIEALVDKTLASESDPARLAEWARTRFSASLTEKDLADPPARRDKLIAAGRELFRLELTRLERYVLLQILDSSWKDHLYAMDILRDSVSTRSIADRERDPRIVFKQEGSGLFNQMRRVVRDRVTDLIFKAKLSSSSQQTRNVYGKQEAQHAEAGSAFDGKAPSAEQQADQDAARNAGSDSDQAMSRKQRRAMAAARSDPGASKKQQRFKDRRRRR